VPQTLFAAIAVFIYRHATEACLLHFGLRIAMSGDGSQKNRRFDSKAHVQYLLESAFQLKNFYFRYSAVWTLSWQQMNGYALSSNLRRHRSLGPEAQRLLSGPTGAVQGVFTTFSNSSPHVILEIDRIRAQLLNVPTGDIFATLAINSGSAYVNDFNAFGRLFQMRAQAASPCGWSRPTSRC
jgi:multidrug efflux pump subunit AcrB